jgi:hypothetical protein
MEFEGISISWFFSAHLWCSHIGNHPHEDLGKFGYWTGGTVKTFVILLLLGDLEQAL